MLRPFVLAGLLLTNVTWVSMAVGESAGPADLIDPRIGVAFPHGSCMPGPCLPHASAYPSPDTPKGGTCGYVPGQPVVGFSQLHTQGTGGTPSYGNFLVSPQIGLETVEAEHASPISGEVTKAYSYQARLERYGIDVAVVPTKHGALYRITYPASDKAYLVIDTARKLGKTAALSEGSVTIDAANAAIRGGGTFFGNWNPAPYQAYFSARVSRAPDEVGVWHDKQIQRGKTQATTAKKEMGAFARFATKGGETIYLKIAVSLKSIEQADRWLAEELPDWDFPARENAAIAAWNVALAAAPAECVSPGEARKFYTALFHAMVAPRDRTGDLPDWPADEPVWDDHYTLWDTWKTEFPLLTLVRPEVVRGNVNAFIARHKHNGLVAAAFIQGKEYNVGQGGDEADNVMADAFVKRVPGIDWEAAYAVMRHNAFQRRTPSYREKGYVSIGEKQDYCWRMKSASGTLAFSYNDYCVAQVAKGLDKTDDYQQLMARSANWKNVWDDSAADGPFTGFVRARRADGRFAETPPREGFNKDFYEGTCWVYSYVVPHDVPGLVAKMGGPDRFIERLCFALHHNLIDFTNEPSFMTLWLFNHLHRPYLTSYWADVLRRKFDDQGYPGDEDSGAMSSLYVFLASGLFPFAGQDRYYLHGPSAQRVTFRPAGGKPFAIVGHNAGPGNIYIQSARLNGRDLTEPWVRHADIAAGGTLEMTMGAKPSAWGCGGRFDPAAAERELAKP